jgi:signal peptidase II
MPASVTLPPSTPGAAAPARAAWVPWFLPALAGVLILDQASKWWLQSQVLTFGPYEGFPPDWPQWLQWHHNPGVAWSMLSGMPWLVVLLTVVLVPVLGVVWWRAFRHLGRIENLAFGCVMGGAIGNLIDRLLSAAGVLRGVRDFIHVDLGFWPCNPWPTFNIADAGLCVGFALIIACSLRPAAAKDA